ncbi:hypothetical protein M422DRAFT_41955 [Sphaerobolus stellatus SS14]|nr:hypothetical protein M422DRAFT_41955 [Sphaerobolus stellatus SS14]
MELESSNESAPPSIAIRWLRPSTSTPYLQLPTAPVTISIADTWIAFTEEESAQCEEAWNALSEEQRAAAETAGESGTRPGSSQATSETGDNQEVPSDTEDTEETVGVTIFEDRLFEVDVRTMELKPIYWQANGPTIKVKRATWMYDETRPVPKRLADQLDIAYKNVQPWQDSYQIELETACQIGVGGFDKLKYLLSGSIDQNEGGNSPRQYVVFEDAHTACITSGSTIQLFSGSFFSSFSRPAKHNAIPFTGTLVYYGYDTAVKAHAHVPKAPVSPPKEFSKEEAAALTNTLGLGIEEDPKTSRPESTKPKRSSRVGDEGRGKVTDLILVVHGIGQGLVSQYESWSFLYAVNYFRQMAKKQAALPSLASILRDKKVQFLPIEWRASLKLGEEQQRERERDGLDNTFTIGDITPKKSIPTVRELMNNVLIEVPYFMSGHQASMIESVKTAHIGYGVLEIQACPFSTKIIPSIQWQLGFDKYGRVHVIGHSLGSVLSAYILSRQPTIQRPLSSMSTEYIRQNKHHFLFNTSTYFTIGSPLPIFIHLNHTQIIARKGRERTKESPNDEALDREGTLGCFAVDSIYNVFHPSDPIAYLLNPCVDSEAAKNLPPSTVPSFNASVMSGLSQRVTRMFEDVMPRSFGSSPPLSRAGSPTRRPAPGRSVPSTFELSGPTGTTQALEGSRAERRFAALNPHGTVDFQLNSEGTFSEYVDMLTAHTSYWKDPNLAAFILVELFANQWDLARTGLVPSTNPQKL